MLAESKNPPTFWGLNLLYQISSQNAFLMVYTIFMLDLTRKYAVVVVLAIIAGNMLYLDWRMLVTPRQIVQNINVGDSSALQNLPSNNPNNTQTTSAQNACPVACLGVIKEATASVKPVTQVINNTQSQAATASVAQEYFIPLGSGSSSSQSWTNLGGVAANVDMSQYPNVRSVLFEVTGYIPTGNEQIWIQLYNATDGYVIPGSQVTMSGGTAQLLTSGNLSLPSGSKLYQVQMQTQLTYPAIVQQARLHITTQ